MPPIGHALPKFYRNFALSFFVLSAIVVASVFYLIWARVTITIFPDTEIISQEFIFEIKPGAVENPLTEKNIVNGKVFSADVEGSSNFNASGSKIFESNIVGEVTIVNNYSKEQALIATTRLAFTDDPDKVIIRLNKDILVPAGGKVTVQVYPEDAENFRSIPPSSFIIPGLWGPLQDRIFAENTEELSQGAKRVSVVTEEDLKAAEKELRKQLYEQALLQVNDKLEQQESLWPKIFSRNIKELNYNVTVGEEVSEFNASMKMEAVIIIFDESHLISVARDKIKASLSSDKQLVGLNPKNFVYEVENYDLAAGTATVKAFLEGRSVLGTTASLLDKNNLTGLTKEQVQAFFADFPEVQKVEVKFQPAWLKKTPRIKEKITIEVEG